MGDTPAPATTPAITAFDADAWIDVVTPNLGLTIDPAYRPCVLAFLRLSAEHADRVQQFALPEELEPAPIFLA